MKNTKQLLLLTIFTFLNFTVHATEVAVVDLAQQHYPHSDGLTGVDLKCYSTLKPDFFVQLNLKEKIEKGDNWTYQQDYAGTYVSHSGPRLLGFTELVDIEAKAQLTRVYVGHSFKAELENGNLFSVHSVYFSSSPDWWPVGITAELTSPEGDSVESFNCEQTMPISVPITTDQPSIIDLEPCNYRTIEQCLRKRNPLVGAIVAGQCLTRNGDLEPCNN